MATHWAERGAGQPIVLIHGLGASSEIWEIVAASLAGDFRAITYDLRGLGRSGRPAGGCDLTDLVGDLDALLRRCGIDRPVLVGHSLGGVIAAAYAIEHPKRVSALAIVAAAGALPAGFDSVLAERAQTARREGMRAVAELHAQVGLPEAFRSAQPELTARYVSILAASDPEAYADLCVATVGHDLTPALDRIVAPTLLVAGELDQAISPKAVQATAARIPHARYEELAGCGHVIPLERPQELADLIRELVVSANEREER